MRGRRAGPSLGRHMRKGISGGTENRSNQKRPCNQGAAMRFESLSPAKIQWPGPHGPMVNQTSVSHAQKSFLIHDARRSSSHILDHL